MVGQSCVHRLMGQAETIGRDRPCPPRPPRSAVTTVIAVIRRDPSRWRQEPCPGGAVSPARPCARVVRFFVRTPLRQPEERRTNNVRGLSSARYHARRVSRSCGAVTSVRIRSVPLWLAALAAVQAVRGKVRPASWRTCGPRGPHAPYIPLVTCTTCRLPPRSSACHVPRIHSAGARSARQSARTAWYLAGRRPGRVRDGGLTEIPGCVAGTAAGEGP